MTSRANPTGIAAAGTGATGGVQVGTATRTGRRPGNQDAVVARTLKGGRHLLAVADGMGGHAGGAEASRVALEALEASLVRGSTLALAVAHANAAVRDAARKLGHHEMGTTLVAALRNGARYRVASVGDSRAYRVDGDGVTQLTRDHTVQEEARDHGPEAAREAARSPWSRALTRGLGMTDPVDVDLHGPYDATEPHVLALTTDGLHDHVTEADLARHAAASSPSDGAEALAVQAYESGSPDNISVLLARFAPDSPLLQPPRGSL